MHFLKRLQQNASATNDPLMEGRIALLRAAVKEQLLNHIKDKFTDEMASYTRSDAALEAYRAMPEAEKTSLKDHLCGRKHGGSELLDDPGAALDKINAASKQVKIRHYWGKNSAQDSSSVRPMSLLIHLAKAYLNDEFTGNLVEKGIGQYKGEVDHTIDHHLQGEIDLLRHDPMPKKFVREMFSDAFLSLPAILKNSQPELYTNSKANPDDLGKRGQAY